MKRKHHRPGRIAALIIWLAVYLGFAHDAYAQNLRLAYFGETLTHYGLRGGMEYTLRHAEKSKSGGRISANDLYFGLKLTLYRHPHNHVGLILAPELGWRHIGKRGGIVQAALSPGLFRSFYEGATWRSDGDGRFERVPLAGQWGFLPGVSVGYGHRLGKAPDAPYSWYLNLHYLRQYPYNRSYLHRPAIELGIIKQTR